MPQQTTVQDSRALRFGSGIFEVGNDEASLVNLGAMTGIVFEETWDVTEIESDNAGKIQVNTSNHVAGLSGDLMEISLSNLELIRGAIDNFENITGDPVPGAEQIVAQGSREYDKFIKIEHQNGDGSPVTVNSVSGSADTTLTEDDDYIIAQNALGEYGVIINDSGTNVTTADQNITINYDYTPNAAVQLSSGGKTEIKPRVVRVTNLDENGKKFQITIFKAKNQEGISIELPTDQSGEIATCPINLQGEIDKTRDPGAQLFEIYDEQGVA